jgi:hypothetical protein
MTRPPEEGFGLLVVEVRVPRRGTGMVANLPHDHRVAVLEERVAAA